MAGHSTERLLESYVATWRSEARYPRTAFFKRLSDFSAVTGPSALTSRAITNEAACAKGILHNHFTDLDGFLAAFVVDRFRLIMERATTLLSRAGEGTVVENLTEAAVSVFGSNALAILSLAMTRAALMLRLRQSHAAGSPSLREIEATFAAYLEAEKKLGRIAPNADIETLALSLVGAVHHLFVTDRLKRIGSQRAYASDRGGAYRGRDCERNRTPLTGHIARVSAGQARGRIRMARSSGVGSK